MSQPLKVHPKDVFAPSDAEVEKLSKTAVANPGGEGGLRRLLCWPRRRIHGKDVQMSWFDKSDDELPSVLVIHFGHDTQRSGHGLESKSMPILEPGYDDDPTPKRVLREVFDRVWAAAFARRG